jgi:hypothetical protein
MILQVFLFHCSYRSPVFASFEGVVTTAASTAHDAAEGAFEHTEKLGHALTLL